jgi:hypothetical protein
MPIQAFSFIPKDIREWSQFFQQTQVTPSDESVRTEQISGAPGASDNRFYVKRSGELVFDALLDADIPASLARDAEVAAADAAIASAAAADLAAHETASDPHPGYLTPAEGDAAYQPLSAVLSMLHTGTGSPESVLTAPVGHLYLRSDGGAGTTLYVKESGAGNTGWVGK